MIEEMYKEEFGDDSVNPVVDSNSISNDRLTDEVDEPSI